MAVNAFGSAPPPLAAQVFRRVLRLVQGRPERVAGTWLGSGADKRETTASGSRRRRQGASTDFLVDSFEQTRESRYGDLRELVDEVPEADGSLRVLIDFIFSGVARGEAFVVDYASNARDEVERVNGRTLTATNLHTVLPRISEEAVWLGDSFTELIFAASELVGQRHLVPEQTRVYEDESGRVDGYWTRADDMSRWRGLLPFQVVHYAHRPARGARYGRSMFASARHLRRRAEAIQDVAVLLALRKMGGEERIFWPFPGEMDDGRIWGWLDQVAEATDDDYWFDDAGELAHRAAAKLDTAPRFLPYRVWGDERVKPEVAQSAPADLKSLVAMLQYMQQRYMVATGVPAAFVGLDRDVNAKATLEQQGLAFMLTVRNRQREAAQLVEDILTRGLLVAGIVPQPEEFTVYLPAPAQFDAELRARTLKLQADATAALVNAGAPLVFALKHVLELDDEEAEEVALAAGSPPSAGGGITTEAVLEALGVAGVRPPATETGGVRVPCAGCGNGNGRYAS